MKYKVTLSGKVYEVEVEKGEAILTDEYDALAPVAPAAPVAAAAVPAAPAEPAAGLASGEVIQAPLPGIILSIKVSERETVKAGQVLLVIEAMKMENEVVAPHDGTVMQVVAQAGKTINTGDPLIVLG